MWIGYVGIANVFWNQYRLIIGDRKAHCALTVIANIASLKMYYFNKYIKKHYAFYYAYSNVGIYLAEWFIYLYKMLIYVVKSVNYHCN